MSERPRVVFLTDIMTPYTVAVQAQLARRVDLVVLFCAASGTRALDWKFDHVPFSYEVLGGLTIRRSHPDATDFYLSPRILAALIRHRPDAIITAGYSFPSAYASLYGAVTRTPLIVHSDGTARSEAGIAGPQEFARKVIVRRALVAAANSEPAAERFEELGFPPDRVVRALHSTNVAPLLAVADARRYEGVGDLRILATGRLIARKGFDRLVRAVAAAHAQRPGITLTIVGSGPEEDALRRAAGPEVTFAGFVDQAGLPAVYAAAGAYAFPSLDDPFGIVLLEAAAAGLPLVASPRAGATNDLVEDGVSGFVLDPEDVDGMAAAFVRLADGPGLRQAMGQAARSRAEHRTPEATAEGYRTAVELALAAGR